MTEVTRVPIQPIAKGSLTKLWLGVVVAILIGAGLAWAAMPKGLSVDTLVAGTGDNPFDFLRRGEADHRQPDAWARADQLAPDSVQKPL
jgi:hypothetical protein